jgi:PhzF family phenazine biosynthesis protein
MKTQIFQVDAFTSQPFKGNPAAVCILDKPQEDQWMQNVAREMNLSETAFLFREGELFKLRWFTPLVEVDLCGHATLASAHVLWSQGYLPAEQQARFSTRSGLLTAQKKGEWIEMDFPAKPEEPTAEPPGLAKALGVEIKYLGRNKFDYLVLVAKEEEVWQIQPDFALLKTLPVRGVMVTSKAAKGPYDFISRFFAPQEGVNEDPVTGSAHCCLGPFWAKRLGKDELLAYQASPRGGLIKVTLQGSRVLLSGQAVTIFQGTLQV